MILNAFLGVCMTPEASKGIASMHITLDANLVSLQRRIHGTILPRMARAARSDQVLQMIR